MGSDDVGSAHDGDVGSAREGGIDPIFQGEERDDRPVKKATLLVQFFFFPLLIASVLVGVLVLANLLSGGSDREAREYLQDLSSGGENVQKQAAHQLAVLIAEERRKEREGKIGKGGPFYREPGFRDGLLSAFEASFPDRSPERQIFLATALGAVGDPSYAEPLAKRLGTVDGPASDDLRRAITGALANLEDPKAVPFLTPLARDSDEMVADIAIVGLAAVHSDASIAALREALGDPRIRVRLHAAAALARFGVDAGLAELERTLDPKEIEALGFRTQDERRAALLNAIRGVRALHVDRAKPKVQALTQDTDDVVRKVARDAIEKWSAAK